MRFRKLLILLTSTGIAAFLAKFPAAAARRPRRAAQSPQTHEEPVSGLFVIYDPVADQGPPPPPGWFAEWTAAGLSTLRRSSPTGEAKTVTAAARAAR